MRLSDVAGLSDVIVQRDGDFHNLCFLHDEQSAALVFVESAPLLKALGRKSNVVAVLTTPQLAPEIPSTLALGVCSEPRVTFARIHNRLAAESFYWEEFSTVVHPSASVHPTAWVAPANVRIGPDCVVGPHATILDRCQLSEGAAVGAGAILGGEGFQAVRSRPMFDMRHAGGLTIRERVRILPGAILATGLFRSPTEIGEEARVGSGAFISHAVRVGARSFVGHGAVVNGNVAIGEEVWIGPGAIVANNISIGKGAFVSLGAVVARNVPADSRVSGNFAIRHRRLLRLLASAEYGEDAAE